MLFIFKSGRFSKFPAHAVRIYIQYRWLMQLEYASTDAATMQSSDLSMLVDTVGDFCLLTSLRTNILTKYVSDAENDPRVTVRVKQVGSTEAARKQYDLYWKLAYRLQKQKVTSYRAWVWHRFARRQQGQPPAPQVSTSPSHGDCDFKETRLWFHMLLQHPCGSPWYRRIFPRSQYSWLCQYRAETCKASELGRW